MDDDEVEPGEETLRMRIPLLGGNEPRTRVVALDPGDDETELSVDIDIPLGLPPRFTGVFGLTKASFFLNSLINESDDDPGLLFSLPGEKKVAPFRFNRLGVAGGEVRFCGDPISLELILEG